MHELHVLCVQLDGATYWLLTTDADYARHCVALQGGEIHETLDVLDLLHQQFDGLAMLTIPCWE